MTKIVVNDQHGGFSVSREAVRRLRAEGLDVDPDGYGYRGHRDDPALVEVVEALGERANGPFARLVVVEVPNEVPWHIGACEGRETIHEDHRSWGPAAQDGGCGA